MNRHKRQPIISLPIAFIQEHWAGLTLVTLAAITLLSLWPLSELPSVPGGDKLHHLVAYAVLMLPVALRKPPRWWLIGLFFVAWSGAIELIQPYVNRYGEWSDLLANALGVLCGVVVAAVVTRLGAALSELERPVSEKQRE
ncbi:MAG: VanZ family protein [Desulfuromonadales bacterium]|nr:VanZ family protein [Desulfuromonadales bacterium]